MRKRKEIYRAPLYHYSQKNNYSVDAVYNGEDAVTYILDGDYDTAILDIMMPKKDGVTALKEIRRAKNNIPILMLTAKSEIDDITLALDSGANDYLTKPFSVKELLARIRAITRRLTSSGDTQLSYWLKMAAIFLLLSKILREMTRRILDTRTFLAKHLFPQDTLLWKQKVMN